MELLPLHKFSSHKESCIQLLNEEWPRSVHVRIMSLDKSCDQLPVSLILIKTDENRVLGHSKLCRIPNKPEDCWIEGVVVWKSERGKGYGKILMIKTEEFAKINGFKTAYLSTHDKQEFYSRLGYEICAPILNVGANGSVLNKPQFENFTKKLTDNTDNCRATVCESSNVASVNFSKPIPPPPVPPPSMQKCASLMNKQVYMKKVFYD